MFQSILKKLHQEAMKVLTLSDFKYLEQLERQGAELERSRVEWNSEKQRMIEQQMVCLLIILLCIAMFELKNIRWRCQSKVGC